MTKKETLGQVLKEAWRWAKPRIIPALVWMCLLPVSVPARLLIGTPVWLFSAALSLVRRVQTARKRKAVPALN